MALPWRNKNPKGILMMNARAKIVFLLLAAVYFSFQAIAQESDLEGITEPKNITPVKQSIDDEDLEKRLKVLTSKIEQLEGRLDELDKRNEQLSALQLSGFFDVSFSNYRNQPNVFKMGLFELDLEHSYDNGFQVAAALVFDDEEGTYLGVGFIDYAFIGGPVPPRGRLFIERGLNVQVGKFDVPLGNDWNYVSAVTRNTVTPPLTTSEIMEGVYNDAGLRILLNLVALNFSIYSTQGVEEKYTYGGISYGTRIGLTPFNNPYTLERDFVPAFELGFSYLQDLDNNGDKSEEISAADLESKIGAFMLRCEYLKREKAAGVTLDGYHVTTGLDFEAVDWFPVVFLVRYDVHREENNVIASDDSSSSDGDDLDSMTRFTGALRFNISDTSFLKFEYQRYLTASERYSSDSLYSESLYYAQLVITF